MAKDAYAWRLKFGVLGPSTNTIVQPEFDDMRPAGVTNHYSRCLLYTSPSPRDRTRSRMPSSA